MKIYYGTELKLIDVTDICLKKLTKNNILTIPSNDHIRTHYFTDPLHGVEKMIMLVMDGVLTQYDIYTRIKINIITHEVIVENDKDLNAKTAIMQSKLKLKYGSFNDELPEQKMAVRYLTGNEKVLEIGGNIGRNTLIIASILYNSANLVSLECDANIANQLIENRDLNNFKFHVEKSALSNRKLIQKGWDTIPSDTLQEGFKWADTITLDNLKTKYGLTFDTLVLDCEGAFYYILMDSPEILDNINLIIMENDYWDISKKNYVDEILMKYGFSVDYSERGGWGPCYDNFFEVWKK
jgi:FkbM family methyltransferase